MNFFYSININDRIRFPILGELKQDPLPSDLPMAEETEKEAAESEMKDLAGSRHSDKVEEDSYFSVFKHANYEKGLYCDEILKFLDGFFQKMRMGGRMRKGMHSLQSFLDSFSSYVHSNAGEFRELMDTMNTKRLITPYIELDLPVHIIEEFNQLEEDDPRVNLYQLNPVWGTAIKEFGFFWERYESTKEVLCMFVWSTIDHAVVPMPAVGLNPYPLCWVCDKGFGTLACNKCKVAKYCSKECQQQDWIQHGGPVCDLMASSLRRVKQLSFKRPPSPSPPTKKNKDDHTPPPSYSPTPPPSHSPSPSPPPSSFSPSSPSLSPSSPSLSPSVSPPQSPPSHPSPPPMDMDDDPPFAIMEHI